MKHTHTQHTCEGLCIDMKPNTSKWGAGRPPTPAIAGGMPPAAPAVSSHNQATNHNNRSLTGPTTFHVKIHIISSTPKAWSLLSISQGKSPRFATLLHSFIHSFYDTTTTHRLIVSVLCQSSHLRVNKHDLGDQTAIPALQSSKTYMGITWIPFVLWEKGKPNIR